MQVAKWGNSLAIRIPAEVVRELGLKEGDNVHLAAIGQGEIAVITERQRRRAIIDRIRAMAVPLPADYKFDREEAIMR